MLLLFYYLLLAIECLKSIFFCSNKSKTPVLFPQVLAVQVLMTILLIASTTSLAMPAVEWYKVHKDHLDRYGRSMSTDGVNVAMLFCALVRYFTFFPKFSFPIVLVSRKNKSSRVSCFLTNDEWMHQRIQEVGLGNHREGRGGGVKILVVSQ